MKCQTSTGVTYKTLLLCSYFVYFHIKILNAKKHLPRMPLRFCANLSFMFQNETDGLLERYSLAKSAGFKGVEVAFPYDADKNELAEAKKQSGLQQVLLNGYPGIFYL